MIARLVNVLSDAGFDLTYDQILDAVWLALHLPRQPSKGSDVVTPVTAARDPISPPRPAEKPPQASAPSPEKKPGAAGAATSSGPAPGELYMPKPGMENSATMRAIPVRVPATEALPNKQGVNAALRPLKRRFPSRRTKVLDVTATVEQIANGGPAIAILKAAPERWFEVALILDESASMRVWRETMQEFAVLLERHGSFRDVRRWYVNLDDATLKLYSEAGLPSSPRRLRSHRELIDPAARRLILVVSDCASRGWRKGAMLSAMLDWGRRGPLALVQVLPERLWGATALGESAERFRAYSAGAPNSSLHAQQVYFDYLQEPEEPEKKTPSPARITIPVPVVNLEGWSVAPWARLVANVGDATAEGVTISVPSRAAESGPEAEKSPPEPQPVLTAEQRVARFRAAASSSAKELAGYLAAAPICLPVMRLVQKAMMPAVRQVDLAEVMLGGLLYQMTPPEQVGRAEDVFYEFFPGVRELLQASVKEADQLRVLRSVSRLIESQTGTTIDFSALLAGGVSTLRPQHLYPVGQKFAEVAANVASRLGWPGATQGSSTGTTEVPVTQIQTPPPPQTEKIPETAEPPLRLYVSFTRHDIRLVQKFNDRLKQLDLEGWTNTRSLLDLKEGAEFQQQLDALLQRSNVLVALLSPQYVSSEWGIRECQAAIEKGMLIVPVFLEPVSMQGHPAFPYLLNPASLPISSASDEDRAIEEIIARLRDIFISKVKSDALEKARKAVVAVRAGGYTSSGFLVSPQGHLLVSGQVGLMQSPMIFFADGSSVPAVALTSNPTAELALLKVDSTALVPHSLPEPLVFGPIADIAQEVMGIDPLSTGFSGDWSGQIVAQDTLYLHASINTSLLPGIAGAPLLDRKGRVVAIFQLFDSQSNQHLCCPGPRAELFVTSILNAESPSRYNLQAAGVRVLSRGEEIVRHASAGLLSARRAAVSGSYAREHISIGPIDCRASQSLRSATGSPAFVMNASVEMAQIVVSERLTIDKIQIIIRQEPSPDGARRPLFFDSALIENMMLDGARIHVVIGPTTNGNASLVRFISTTHTAVAIDRHVLMVSGLGRIEILPVEEFGTSSSVCGLRVRIDYEPQTVIEVGSIILTELIQAADVDPVPQTASRLGVLVVGTGWLQLPKPVQYAAEQVGAAVANAGGILITGGWPGVDHLAARSFSEAIGQENPPRLDDLVQIIEGQEADFKGGKVIRVEQNRRSEESLKHADVVILIGGAGGTWEAFRSALSQKKLVIPFLNTGTDARHAAILLEVFGQNVPTPLVKAEFGDETQAPQAGKLLQAVLSGLDTKAGAPEVDNQELLWMTETVLSSADTYLRRKSGFDEEANRIYQEFKSHELSPTKCEQLVFALIEDEDPAWRCTAYLAIEAAPHERFIAPLIKSLATEMAFALARTETRPLWRSLSATNRLIDAYPQSFPMDFYVSLESADRTIRTRPEVDPGGECKASISGILQKLRSALTSSASGQPFSERIATLIHQTEEIRDRAFDDLLQLGKRAVPLFESLLSNDNETMRMIGARYLGRLGPVAEDAVTALVSALSDKDEVVRLETATALREIGPSAMKAVPALIFALQDVSGVVRQNAVLALGGIGPAARDAVPALHAALQDTSQLVRQNAELAIGQIEVGSSKQVVRPAAKPGKQKSDTKDLENPATLERAEAWILSGSIESPFNASIPSQGTVTLPQPGGRVEQSLENFRVRDIISFTRGSSHASGDRDDTRGTQSTIVQATIEGLNVLDVLTADKVVAQISIQHSADGLQPTVNFLGTRFEDLRIAGQPIQVVLYYSSAGQIFRRGATSIPGSLVRSVSGNLSFGRIVGNVMEVPDYGEIVLAELVFDLDSVQLTMIRAQLTGKIRGSITACRASATTHHEEQQ